MTATWHDMSVRITPGFYLQKWIITYFPKLLSQKEIHQRCNRHDLTRIAILMIERHETYRKQQIAQNGRWGAHRICLRWNKTVIQKYVQYTDVPLHHFKHKMKPYNMAMCLKNGHSPVEVVNACFEKKDAEQMLELVKYYRERGRLLFNGLFFLPAVLADMVIDYLDE
jgi:hypothetical protein